MSSSIPKHFEGKVAVVTASTDGYVNIAGCENYVLGVMTMCAA